MQGFFCLFFNETSFHVTHVQWMVLGTSGPPGAFVHPRAVVVIVTVPVPARCLKMEESPAAAHQDKLNFATSLSAQVRQPTLYHESLFNADLNSKQTKKKQQLLN